MLKISGPVRAALFAAIALASANTSFLIGSARADSCAAAPAGAAPAGQHWYYHVDRATRHKCWYLHATVALHHRAMIRHHEAADTDAAPDPQAAAAPAAAPTPADSPAALPTPPAPATDNPTDAATPAPHVTVLSVKTSTPFVATTTTPQQNTSYQAAPPAAPQTTAPRAETVPAMAAPKPVADTDGAAPQDKANAAFNAPAQTAEAATDAARTRTAEEFILLALVLGVAAAMTAIINKIVNIYRRPRISVDPDAAWLSFRSEQQRVNAQDEYEDPDVPFLDPREQYGLADLHRQEWLDRSAPEQNRPSVPPVRNAEAPQQRRQPRQADIEPALRALRQARQN